MLPVEPLAEPSVDDAGRESARQWIANLQPARKPTKRKWKQPWTRKEPKPVVAVQDAEPTNSDWCQGCTWRCVDDAPDRAMSAHEREMRALGYVPCRDPLNAVVPF